MMIYSRLPKSKKRKVPKAVKAQHDAWLKSIERMAIKIKVPATGTFGPQIPTLKAPPGRETVHYPSRDTGLGVATKPVEPQRYTGTKMIGVATMHKSNAVPVFNDEAAVEISSMRR